MLHNAKPPRHTHSLGFQVSEQMETGFGTDVLILIGGRDDRAGSGLTHCPVPTQVTTTTPTVAFTRRPAIKSRTRVSLPQPSRRRGRGCPTFPAPAVPRRDRGPFYEPLRKNKAENEREEKPQRSIKHKKNFGNILIRPALRLQTTEKVCLRPGD